MRPPGQFACLVIRAFSFELNDDVHESPQLELEFPSPDPGPDEILQVKQEELRVRAFVHALKFADRDVVHRHFWNDEPQAEIACSRNVSEAAISKRLRKIYTLGRSSLADRKVSD